MLKILATLLYQTMIWQRLLSKRMNSWKVMFKLSEAAEAEEDLPQPELGEGPEEPFVELVELVVSPTKCCMDNLSSQSHHQLPRSTRLQGKEFPSPDSLADLSHGSDAVSESNSGYMLNLPLCRLDSAQESKICNCLQKPGFLLACLAGLSMFIITREFFVNLLRLLPR